ncbi:MAG: flippase-like domain-containing protein [Deltaproteobacteria bacterium]|uniref:Flippase-like domain-containing protein n=1 Tax=Candidatus Zymogenus saltonus TaxID=2844893 RepID=A0A9D8KHK8_9DELT|nr:flippase-like domain-containing protein [Candidatus Zymogenus saltonus]
MKKTIKTILKFTIGLLLFFVVVALFSGFKDIDRLFKINWLMAWPVVILTFIVNFMDAWKLHVIINHFSKKGDLITLLRYIIMGRFVGHSTSQMFGDMGSRFLYTKSIGIDLKRGTFAIILDKLLIGILLGCIIVTIPVVVAFEEFERYTSIVPLVSAVLFAISISLMPAVISIFIRFFPKRDILKQLRTMVSGRLRWLLFFLTIGKFLLSAIRFLFIMRLCQIDLAFAKVFMGTAIVQGSMIVGITPGGLGLVEAGWAGVLYFYKVPSLNSASFLVNQRLLIFGSILLLSLLFVIHNGLKKRFSTPKEKPPTSDSQPK